MRLEPLSSERASSAFRGAEASYGGGSERRTAGSRDRTARSRGRAAHSRRDRTACSPGRTACSPGRTARSRGRACSRSRSCSCSRSQTASGCRCREQEEQARQACSPRGRNNSGARTGGCRYPGPQGASRYAAGSGCACYFGPRAGPGCGSFIANPAAVSRTQSHAPCHRAGCRIEYRSECACAIAFGVRGLSVREICRCGSGRDVHAPDERPAKLRQKFPPADHQAGQRTSHASARALLFLTS